jgi:hypothetical protein
LQNGPPWSDNSGFHVQALMRHWIAIIEDSKTLYKEDEDHACTEYEKTF